ncbi:hypothetical protein MAR_019813, partial [Mya arenaria]
ILTDILCKEFPTGHPSDDVTIATLPSARPLFPECARQCRAMDMTVEIHSMLLEVTSFTQ